jgi:pimeloyl-ACP methyl ester carboxylesterase
MAGTGFWFRMALVFLPFWLVFNSLRLSYPDRAEQPAIQDQDISGTLALLDRSGEVEQALVDGNLIQLRLTLNQKTNQEMDIRFALDEVDVAACSIVVDGDSCTSGLFYSLGWYWDASGAAQALGVLKALYGVEEIASLTVQVRPRPVVMVHGFASSWEAWENYLGPEGYLSAAGIQSFAVGDGQVEGQMNTGSLANPSERTNTIHQNAEVVGRYIENVKDLTGAELVDLIAHSMGGLISRYYIDQVMEDRDVTQLIMLGSPMAGTECANLPASLGLYLPAALEIRPSYVEGIFNQQVTRRAGMTFYALAGNPIIDAFKSPCTTVPTDIAVSQNSVTAIPVEAKFMSVLHMELNTSEVVFTDFVLPLLKKTTGQYPDQPDPPQAESTGQPLQFTRVFTGHLDPGQSEEIVIQIEEGVAVAGFSLFDTSRSLANRVVGASGNEIELSPDVNGLVVVNDPSSLFYLGYGFNNPRPGQWRVTLTTTAETPPEGADYALTAYMIGGARLDASALPLLPQVNETVAVEASLSLNGQPVDIQNAQVRIRKPGGEILDLDLATSGSQASASWQPDVEGLYGIDLLVRGEIAEGVTIERTGFLSIQAQPVAPSTQTVVVALIVLGIGFLFIAGSLGVFFILRRLRDS